MEPEYSGFCRGCNSYSEHLMLRPFRNNLTGTLEVSHFCPECRKRFGLFPYAKDEVERINAQVSVDCEMVTNWRLIGDF